MWTREGLGRSFIYGYNADGERVAIRDLQADSFRFTIRDLDNRVIREFIYENDAYRWDQDWVHANGKVIASVHGEGIKHYHVDHIGTPRLVTDGSGLRSTFNSYSPFGVLVAGEGGNRLQLCGHESDPAQIYYLHTRYYSDLTGAFLSLDPKRGELMSSQSRILYAYVRNSPVARIDQFGGVDQSAFDAHNNMPDTPPPPLTEAQLAQTQRVGATMVGMGVTAALGYFTAGSSILINILLTGPAANIAGGIVTRGLDGNDATEPLNKGAVTVDYITGAAGASVGTVAAGSRAATATMDDALGAGGARLLSEAAANATVPAANEALTVVVEQIPFEGENPSASDPGVNCHLQNDPLNFRADIDVQLVPAH
jgi:RHS repeat-associated protein